jgi:hypothetical protein
MFVLLLLFVSYAAQIWLLCWYYIHVYLLCCFWMFVMLLLFVSYNFAVICLLCCYYIFVMLIYMVVMLLLYVCNVDLYGCCVAVIWLLCCCYTCLLCCCWMFVILHCIFVMFLLYMPFMLILYACYFAIIDNYVFLFQRESPMNGVHGVIAAPRVGPDGGHDTDSAVTARRRRDWACNQNHASFTITVQVTLFVLKISCCFFNFYEKISLRPKKESRH